MWVANFHANHARLGPLCRQRGGHPPSRGVVSDRRGVARRARRGGSAPAAGAAGFPIGEEPPGGPFVVEVPKRRGRRARADVTVRAEPPDHWSIVARTGVLRPTLGGRGGDVVTTYAVCPLCRYRQDFAAKPATLKCVRCGATSPVDWSETC